MKSSYFSSACFAQSTAYCCISCGIWDFKITVFCSDILLDL
jgi:hypothetical protein